MNEFFESVQIENYGSTDSFKINIIPNNSVDFQKEDIINIIFRSLIKKQKKRIKSLEINGYKFLIKEEIKILNLILNFYYSALDTIHIVNCNKNYVNCEHNELIRLLKPKFNAEEIISVINAIYNDENLELNNISEKCAKCIKKLSKTFKNLHNKLIKSKLALFFREKFGSLNLTKNNILVQFPSLDSGSIFNNFKETVNNKPILREYFFFEKIYKSKIYDNKKDFRNSYEITLNLSKFQLNNFKLIEDILENKVKNIEMELFMNLGDKIKYLQDQTKILLNNYYLDLDDLSKHKLSLVISLKILKIDRIFPLLVDPLVEEIFMDKMHDFLYLNHQDFGKCDTKISLSSTEIEAIKTHIKLESKMRLDNFNPSLMYIMQNKYFYCRFSIDIYPKHWKDISIDIRKLRKNVFTLFNLIKNSTLNNDIAYIIILCVLFKKNITIAGEINSGKTTLLNSIDLIIPSSYRKVYVENSIETLEIPFKYNYQLKFITPDLNSTKEKEIYTLLHRSGDYIILGELLSKNETEAFFHCLSTGLKGLQTTHAASLESLVNRWLIHFNIQKTNLNDLDIILIMKKIGNRRIIQSLNEVVYDHKKNDLILQYLIKYNPKQNDWDKILPIKQSKLMKSINEIFYLPEESQDQIKTVINNFLYTKNNQKLRNLYNPLKSIIAELSIIHPLFKVI